MPDDTTLPVRPDPAEPATPAATPTASGARRPGRWWHWLFLYPATTAALLTAVPEWSDKLFEIYEGLTGTQTTIAEARRRSDLINKNMACLRTPELWVTTSRVNVDGTICDSGDILIRASTEDGRRAFEIFETARLLDLQQTQPTRAASALLDRLLAGTAEAAPVSATKARPAAKADTRERLAQESFVITICQKYVDKRNLLRHVRVDGVCYDEMLDTYTGLVGKRVQVPCRATCN